MYRFILAAAAVLGTAITLYGVMLQGGRKMKHRYILFDEIKKETFELIREPFTAGQLKELARDHIQILAIY